jgi:molybdopterin-guanine dinucleotide biosynthesis protein A
MTVVVLAGGKGRRMGESKARILLGGVSLLERVVQRLKVLFPRVIVVASPQDSIFVAGAETVHDPVEGYGSLMGIHTGLNYAKQAVFVAACDMPFLNQGLIRHMIDSSSGFDVVVPKPGGLYEPLHAVYSAACIPYMEELINKGERRIISFYEKVKVLEISDDVLDRFDPQRLSFFNINSPEDLARAEEILAEGA